MTDDGLLLGFWVAAFVVLGSIANITAALSHMW